MRGNGHPGPPVANSSTSWSGLLHQAYLLPFLLKGVQDQALVAELVGNGQVALHLLKEVFERAGVAPGQQAIQIPNLGIEFIVALGADGHDAVRAE